MLRIPALPLPIYFCENNDNNNMSCVKHNKCRRGSKPSWKFPSCFRAGQGSLQREEGQLGVITRVFSISPQKQFRFYLPMFYCFGWHTIVCLYTKAKSSNTPCSQPTSSKANPGNSIYVLFGNHRPYIQKFLPICDGRQPTKNNCAGV